MILKVAITSLQPHSIISMQWRFIDFGEVETGFLNVNFELQKGNLITAVKW